MKRLALASAAACLLAFLGACGLEQIVTVDPVALQAKIEEMSGMTPSEQCGVYDLVKRFGSAEMLAKAEAIIERADFVCAAPAA